MRLELEEREDGCRVKIPAPRLYPGMVFLAIFLGVWATATWLSFQSVLYGSQSLHVTLPAAVFLTAGCLAIIGQLLWLAVGFECVRLDRTSLEQQWEIFRPFRRRRFAYGDLRAVRVNATQIAWPVEHKVLHLWKFFGEGGLAFSVRGKTHTLGRTLSREEAEWLCELIRRYLDRFAPAVEPSGPQNPAE